MDCAKGGAPAFVVLTAEHQWQRHTEPGVSLERENPRWLQRSTDSLLRLPMRSSVDGIEAMRMATMSAGWDVNLADRPALIFRDISVCRSPAQIE